MKRVLIFLVHRTGFLDKMKKFFLDTICDHIVLRAEVRQYVMSSLCSDHRAAVWPGILDATTSSPFEFSTSFRYNVKLFTFPDCDQNCSKAGLVCVLNLTTTVMAGSWPQSFCHSDRSFPYLPLPNRACNQLQWSYIYPSLSSNLRPLSSELQTPH